MAGGTFEVNVSKKRPGDYINFKSKRQQSPNGSTRGTALIPLIGLGWGPDKGILKLTAASPDADVAKLGHSIYDTNDFMLLIRGHSRMLLPLLFTLSTMETRQRRQQEE